MASDPRTAFVTEMACIESPEKLPRAFNSNTLYELKWKRERKDGEDDRYYWCRGKVFYCVRFMDAFPRTVKVYVWTAEWRECFQPEWTATEVAEMKEFAPPTLQRASDSVYARHWHLIQAELTRAIKAQEVYLIDGTGEFYDANQTVCQQCSYFQGFPGITRVKEDQTDKGQPGDRMPICAKSQLSNLQHWDGHRNFACPKGMRCHRLFKCRMGYWIVVNGLHDDGV